MRPEIFVKSGESVLQHPSLGVLELARDGHGGGGDVAHPQDQEQDGQDRDLPGDLMCVNQLVECVRVVKLGEVSNVQEWQEKAQTFPHP